MRRRMSHTHGRLWTLSQHTSDCGTKEATIADKFGVALEGDAFLRLETPRKKRKREITLPQIKGWTK